MKPGRLVPCVALCLALPVGPLAQAQVQQPPPATTSTQTQTNQTQTQTTQTQTTDPQTPPSPDNLNRIREGLKRPNVLKMDGQPRIYVDIFGKWPTFAEMTKGYDLINGPTGNVGNAMSHQEFLGMVTPKEMVGSGGVSPGEILTMAAVNYVGQKLVALGIEKLGNAKKDKKLTAIQTQIDRELAALRGGK
jgi:hypothetical protein